jgi:ankyrin repeat protein
LDATWEAGLENAVRDDDLPAVANFLAQGTHAEVAVKMGEQFTNGGMTILQWAAKKGSAQAVPALLAAGARASLAHTPTGTTSLMFAAREGNLAAAAELLAAPPEVVRLEEERNCAAQAALDHAAAGSPEEGAAQLLGAADEHGNTALHLAAFECHAELAAALVQAAEVAATPAILFSANAQGATALHMAAFYCPAKPGDQGAAFARALLGGGGGGGAGSSGGVDALTSTGRSALMLAAQRGAAAFAGALVDGDGGASNAVADACLASPVDRETAAGLARRNGFGALADELEASAAAQATARAYDSEL